jgi:hypothetical protein
VATGAVLGALALSRHAAAQEQSDADVAWSLQSNAVNLSRAANWAFGVGGAVAAAGLTWIAIDLARPAPKSAALDRVTLVAGSGRIGIVGVLR